MRSTTPLTITLPQEMARAVKARVASGAYASDSEVMREGLRALDAQEKAVERWLAGEGVARFDAYAAGREETFSADEMQSRLRDHVAKRAKLSRG
jgi:putative addiction module CopG family antidote